MWSKLGLAVIATLVLIFALGAPALAATPQDIYNDYADNAKLDGTYTQAELEAYLNDATLHQYGDPTVLQPLDALVTTVLGNMRAGMSYEDALAAATGGKTVDGGRTTMPFTGFELLVALAGGVALIGGGVAIRRNAR